MGWYLFWCIFKDHRSLWCTGSLLPTPVIPWSHAAICSLRENISLLLTAGFIMKLFSPQHPMILNYGKKETENYPQFHSPVMLESPLLFFPACICIIATTGAHFKKHFEWPFPISQQTELISHTYLKQKPWKEQGSLCDYFPVTRFRFLYLLKGEISLYLFK